MTIALLAAYFAAFTLLALFSLHRCWLLHLNRRAAPPPSPRSPPDAWPTVTIQLPIYNERFVAARLLRAIFALDYPHELLHIQVLDDSCDDTTARIAESIRCECPSTLTVEHIRRGTRSGYKAGALAHGAHRARGEFTLIMDADFVPGPSLLRELLPPFQDPGVALVQARWTHINAQTNRLTEAQALLLDAHFLIETNARYRAGVFFNFHGTAGLWRTRAIEDAGGWQADTLTEDLDLSYRAQLRGWRFVFLPNVEVPAELPESLPAFKQQQARWAEGTIATARKHLGTVLRGVWPGRTKLEACMQLLAHTIYPATLLLALLAVPAMWVRRDVQQPLWLLADLGLALCVIIPTRVFYRTAARAAGSRIPGVRDFPYLTLTGIALAVSNTRAVCAGLWGSRNHFVRTPKFAAAERGLRSRYHVRSGNFLRLIEGGVAAYLVVGAILAASAGMPVAVPMLSFFALAFGVTSAKG
jgi:cellulose synthase/poly-beta-1,6-N-acetylglucosamine synthase-like glycosyltransferase